MAKLTLNIAKAYDKGFISDIEKNKYFQLHKNATIRAELYCFAIALGLMEGKKPTPLSSVGATDTFVRTAYLTNYEPYLSALYYNAKIKDNPEAIDDICNRDEVYTLAEQYANSGFGVLKEYFENIDEETLLYKLITYMDKEYEVIKDELDTLL